MIQDTLGYTLNDLLKLFQYIQNTSILVGEREERKRNKKKHDSLILWLEHLARKKGKPEKGGSVPVPAPINVCVFYIKQFLDSRQVNTSDYRVMFPLALSFWPNIWMLISRRVFGVVIFLPIFPTQIWV